MSSIWADVVWSLLSSSNSWQDICCAGDWRSRKINRLLVANLLKTLFLCSPGKTLKLWPSYNSKDSIPYWEKLHNHFWLEREHLWRALNLSFKDVWRVSINGCFWRENWSLNSKINFFFIFNRKKTNLLGGQGKLFCWEVKYLKTDTCWPQIVRFKYPTTIFHENS